MPQLSFRLPASGWYHKTITAAKAMIGPKELKKMKTTHCIEERFFLTIYRTNYLDAERLAEEGFRNCPLLLLVDFVAQ